MSPSLGALERALINRFQGGFPVVGRPFSSVAARLGTREPTLISSIRRLLEAGVLSRFGPLYNAERLGGGLMLAALAVPDADFDRVAGQVNAFPEVAHNYRREHRLNQWFVLATERPEQIPETLERIEVATGLPAYPFPKQKEFYLGLWLELHEQGRVGTRSVAEPTLGSPVAPDALDRRILAATQGGLPLTPEPWEMIAERIGCLPAEVSGRLQNMLARGAIRRIGAVPNHYRLGLRGNGMAVWDIPDRRLDAVGRRVGALDYVSHCYARPRHPPDWPYNLFAMVHGHDRAEVREKVEKIARMLGPESLGHRVLFSTAVLKKTGLRLARGESMGPAGGKLAWTSSRAGGPRCFV
jgi:DNA-binding Lrp family transcriptional regulator